MLSRFKKNETPSVAPSVMSVGDIRNLSRGTVLAQVAIPNQEGTIMYSQSRQNGPKLPFFNTDIRLVKSEYLSEARETLGQLLVGVSVQWIGYPCNVDDEGKAIVDQIQNEDGSITEVYSLDNMVNGAPAPAKIMATAYVEWNADFGGSQNNRSKNIDVLNFRPAQGAPTEPRPAANGKTYYNLDWVSLGSTENVIKNAIIFNPALKQELEAALTVNPKDKEALATLETVLVMEDIIASIKVNPNAPSMRVQQDQAARATPVATAAGADSIPANQFDGEPE